MTRKEFYNTFTTAITRPIEHYADGTICYELVGNDTDIESVVEHITSLEQQLKEAKDTIESQEIMLDDMKKRIAELESPKSCRGCIYHENNKCTHWSAKHEDCCIRYNNPKDYYESEDDS